MGTLLNVKAYLNCWCSTCSRLVGLLPNWVAVASDSAFHLQGIAFPGFCLSSKGWACQKLVIKLIVAWQCSAIYAFERRH